MSLRRPDRFTVRGSCSQVRRPQAPVCQEGSAVAAAAKPGPPAATGARPAGFRARIGLAPTASAPARASRFRLEHRTRRVVATMSTRRGPARRRGARPVPREGAAGRVRRSRPDDRFPGFLRAVAPYGRGRVKSRRRPRSLRRRVPADRRRSTNAAADSPSAARTGDLRKLHQLGCGTCSRRGPKGSAPGLGSGGAVVGAGATSAPRTARVFAALATATEAAHRSRSTPCG